MGHTSRELRLRNGALLLSHNQLAFLQGLLDRPGGIARSRRDLVRAALPHVRRYRPVLPSYWTLFHASANLPIVWASRRRVGRRIEFRLSERGRAILEGTVPVHLRGIGPYLPRCSRHRSG